MINDFFSKLRQNVVAEIDHQAESLNKLWLSK